MQDELVTRLRTLAAASINYATGESHDPVYDEAADRIEALERDNNAITDKATEWACKVSDLLEEITNLKQAAHETRMAALSSTTAPDALVEAQSWRCFHCDEVFTDRQDALAHFGDNILATPACWLTQDQRGLVGIIREQEAELRQHRSEDTASYREFYSLGAAHTTALMREEERGYERGLADGRALSGGESGNG